MRRRNRKISNSIPAACVGFEKRQGARIVESRRHTTLLKMVAEWVAAISLNTVNVIDMLGVAASRGFRAKGWWEWGNTDSLDRERGE